MEKSAPFYFGLFHDPREIIPKLTQFFSSVQHPLGTENIVGGGGAGLSGLW